MLDLSALAAVVEEYLPDECTIARNPGGAADDILDRDTEQVTAGSAPVYAGPCVLGAPHGDQIGRTTVAEDEQTPTILRLRLPLSRLAGHPEREPQVGDRAVMSVATYDPNLQGRTLVVTEVLRASYVTVRTCMVRAL